MVLVLLWMLLFAMTPPLMAQVKQHSEESGIGGDWAVRLSASRVLGRGTARKRISLVMYLGDEGVAKPPGWNVMPEGEVGVLSRIVDKCNLLLLLTFQRLS